MCVCTYVCTSILYVLLLYFAYIRCVCLLVCFLFHVQLPAVGTSQGKVVVLSLDPSRGEVVCPVSAFVAHQPQPGKHDNRFGQLGKQ